MMPDESPPAGPVSVLAHSVNASTRFLLEASLDPVHFELTFADDAVAFQRAAIQNESAVYVVDTLDADAPDGRSTLATDTLAQRLKHMLRLLLIVDEPPADDNPMQPFGPLRYLPYHFTRRQCNEVFSDIAAVQEKDWRIKTRDTGSRVKIDPKFVDIRRL